MKSIVAGLLLLLAIPAQAQFMWGVKGGMNVSRVAFDSKEGVSVDRNGFFIGPMLEFTFPMGVGLDGSLLYSQRGVRDEKYKQMGFDIPLNLKYTYGFGRGSGVFVALGPDFYFDFKKDGRWEEHRRAMVGINIGGGLRLFKHLQLGFNYNIALGPSGEVTPGEALDAVFGIGEYKNKTWQVSAAVLF